MGWKMTQQGAPGPGQLRSKSYAGALANLEKLCERMEEMVISWWFDGDLMGFNGKNMEELHGKSWKKWWFRDLTKKNGVLMEFRQQQWWIGFNGDRMRIYRDILWYTQLWTLARTKVFVGWFWEICEFSHHFLGQILTRHILSDGQWWCQTDRSNDIQRSQIQDVLFRSNNIQRLPENPTSFEHSKKRARLRWKEFGEVSAHTDYIELCEVTNIPELELRDRIARLYI